MIFFFAVWKLSVCLAQTKYPSVSHEDGQMVAPKEKVSQGKNGTYAECTSRYIQKIYQLTLDLCDCMDAHFAHNSKQKNIDSQLSHAKVRICPDNKASNKFGP